MSNDSGGAPKRKRASDEPVAPGDAPVWEPPSGPDDDPRLPGPRGGTAEDVIRVLVVDDHELVRTLMEMYLNREPDIHVVGHAGTGREAVSVATKTRPDVVLLDIAMPGGSGLEVLPVIKDALPSTDVVMLTFMGNSESVASSREAGASAYVLKDAALNDLVRTVRAVAGRGAAIMEPFEGLLFFRHNDDESAPLFSIAKGAGLSSREVEVLRLLSKGSTRRSVASELFLSESTVRTLIHSIYAKLDAHSTLGAVNAARASGYLTVND